MITKVENEPGGGIAFQERAFDGSLKSNAYTVGGNKNSANCVFMPTDGIVFTDKIEVYFNQVAPLPLTVKAEVNGSSLPETCNSDIAIGWFTVVSGGGTLNRLEFGYDGCNGTDIGSMSWCAFAVDGHILVDSDLPLASAGGELLRQTWLEWNNVAVLRADNPAHVAKFNAIKASLDAYAPDSISYRAALRQRLIAAGFTVPEIVQFGLVEEGEIPVAVAGYFPLYSTLQAAKDAGNGSAHSHVFNNVTYYMPDAGVDIYHGNYTGDSNSSGY